MNIEYRGLSIKLTQDEYADNPNEWGNEDCFLVSALDRYLWVPPRGAKTTTEIHNALDELWRSGDFHHFAVDAYIHGGVALALRGSVEAHNFPDRQWDVTTGSVFVFVRKSGGWNWDEITPEEVAKSVVDEWNTYLSGDVWNVAIEDADGETIETCGGYYGEEHAIEEAKSTIDFHLDRATAKKMVVFILFSDHTWEPFNILYPADKTWEQAAWEQVRDPMGKRDIYGFIPAIEPMKEKEVA